MNIPICIDKIYFIKQVLQSNIAGIEYNTWKHNSSKNWHREREWPLTASRFGDICRATDHCNRLKFCACIYTPVNPKASAMLHQASKRKL